MTTIPVADVAHLITFLQQMCTEVWLFFEYFYVPNILRFDDPKIHRVENNKVHTWPTSSFPNKVSYFLFFPGSVPRQRNFLISIRYDTHVNRVKHVVFNWAELLVSMSVMKFTIQCYIGQNITQPYVLNVMNIFMG